MEQKKATPTHENTHDSSLWFWPANAKNKTLLRSCQVQGTKFLQPSIFSLRYLKFCFQFSITRLYFTPNYHAELSDEEVFEQNTHSNQDTREKTRVVCLRSTEQQVNKKNKAQLHRKFWDETVQKNHRMLPGGEENTFPPTHLNGSEPFEVWTQPPKNENRWALSSSEKDEIRLWTSSHTHTILYPTLNCSVLFYGLGLACPVSHVYYTEHVIFQ